MYLLLDDGPADGFSYVTYADVPPKLIFVQMIRTTTPCEVSTVYMEPHVRSWGDAVARGDVPYRISTEDRCPRSDHTHYEVTTLYALLRDQVGT